MSEALLESFEYAGAVPPVELPLTKKRRKPSSSTRSKRSAVVFTALPLLAGSPPPPVVLVLGSASCSTSIEKKEYYANPVNMFWKIMASVLDLGEGGFAALSYSARVGVLRARGVALWNSCSTFRRYGCYDDSLLCEEPCDVERFLMSELGSKVRAIGFNGATSFKLFKKHCVTYSRIGKGERLYLHSRKLDLVHLPSSSPNHAAEPLESKARKWRKALQRYCDP